MLIFFIISLAITVSLMLIVAIAIIWLWALSKVDPGAEGTAREQRHWKLVNGLSSIVVMLPLFAGPLVFAMLLVSGPMFATWAVSEYFLTPWAGILVAVAAFPAFWLRGRRPVIYGILEYVAGFGTATLAASAPNPDLLPRLLALAGGAYIMVRGLDNIEKGLRGSLRDAWLWVFRKAPQ